jgi:phosphatidylinositol-3-phosphatase
MDRRTRARRTAVAIAATGAAALGLALVPAVAASAHVGNQLPLPPGAIRHIIVIELENESIGETFGPGSPATYLNDTLLPQGELLQNYYAVGHVSLDNYISQVSGQAPNQVTSSDCVTSLTSLTGSYNDVTPGTLAPDQAAYPG